MWAFLSSSVGAGNGIRTRDIQLGRLTLYQLSYSRGSSPFGGGRRIRTFEGVSRQIYSLLPLAARASLLKRCGRQSPSRPKKSPAGWSWRRESNPRPSAYKADALPAELRQPNPSFLLRCFRQKETPLQRRETPCRGSTPPCQVAGGGASKRAVGRGSSPIRTGTSHWIRPSGSGWK